MRKIMLLAVAILFATACSKSNNAAPALKAKTPKGTVTVPNKTNPSQKPPSTAKPVTPAAPASQVSELDSIDFQWVQYIFSLGYEALDANAAPGSSMQGSFPSNYCLQLVTVSADGSFSDDTNEYVNLVNQSCSSLGSMPADPSDVVDTLTWQYITSLGADDLNFTISVQDPSSNSYVPVGELEVTYDQNSNITGASILSWMAGSEASAASTPVGQALSTTMAQ